jgi:monoamine oxidase
MIWNAGLVDSGNLHQRWAIRRFFGFGICVGLRKLAERLGEGTLHFKLPVKMAARDKIVHVRTADGREWQVDDVVLAVPPSVWHKITFEPPLPRDLQIQMGVNVKYLAVVKQRFWQEARSSVDTLCDNQLGMTWEATDKQPGDGGAASRLCRRSARRDGLPPDTRRAQSRLLQTV